MRAPKSIRCREIKEQDLDGVVRLLKSCFRERRPSFWKHAFRLLGKREVPSGLPRYGYLLESDGAVVGAILLIFATVPDQDVSVLRCNLSSWCVKEEFKAYASMLVARALKHREATYLNLTPAPHTWTTLAAQGFNRYCDGRLIAAPILSAPGGLACQIATVDDATLPGPDLTQAEIDLLRTHSSLYGCLSVICTVEGRRHPFVFARWRKYGVVRLLALIYCRDVREFTAFANALGRFFLRRGYLLVVLDANGPVEGLVGRYAGGRPKYFRGAHPPRLGDAAHSERVLTGF